MKRAWLGVLAVPCSLATAATPPGSGEDPPPPPEAAPAQRAREMVYATAGFLVGADHFLDSGIAVEGGARLGELPLVAYVRGAKGIALDADNSGGFWSVIAGLDGRVYHPAGSGVGIGFAGAFVGHEHQTWNPTDPDARELHRGKLIGGRIGYEIGGATWFARGTFELYEYHREATGSLDTMTTWTKGGAMTLGLGARL